jgi:hypothetical protein
MAGERSVAGEAIFAPPVVGDAAVVGHRSLGRPLPQAVGAAPEGRRSPGIGGRSCGPPVSHGRDYRRLLAHWIGRNRRKNGKERESESDTGNGRFPCGDWGLARPPMRTRRASTGPKQTSGRDETQHCVIWRGCWNGFSRRFFFTDIK